MKKKKGCFLKFVFFAVLLVLLIRAAFYDNLTVVKYTVKNDIVTKNHTFVVITDLHSTYYGDDQEELAERIISYSPEAVFFVGDISDEENGFNGTESILRRIAGLYSCYFTAGNHERWINFTDDINSLMESYGVTPMGEKTLDLGDGIRLFGLDDPLFYNGDFTKKLADSDTSDEYFDILMSHRPEYAEEYANAGFDLTVCGHAHGGQVRIPIVLNGLYAPNQGFFPKYAGGRYEIDGKTVIVSRGLAINEIPRFFNPPELVVIEIERE